ncbi:transposase, partial [Bacteroides sp. HF-5092]
MRSIGAHYGVNGSNLSRQYKEIFSGYRQWKQLCHADGYVLYPQNIGPNLAIDESSLSCGELYTFVTNRDAHGGKGALVAAIRGTRAETVIAVLEKISSARRKTVREITLDLSSSMMLIARRSFPKAIVTNDRFHVHKLYYDAIDELRISLRWMARDIENEEIARCRREGIPYVPYRYANGDTRKQLLARAKYILTKHASKWTKSQQWRADIIFEFYPELKHAYDLAMDLTRIFNQKVDKDTARLNLARWYDKVEKM